MKCTRCDAQLEGDGSVVSFVLHDAIYTVQFDIPCMVALIGHPNVRRLRNLAFETGWKQLGLPLLNEWGTR